MKITKLNKTTDRSPSKREPTPKKQGPKTFASIFKEELDKEKGR